MQGTMGFQAIIKMAQKALEPKGGVLLPKEGRLEALAREAGVDLQELQSLPLGVRKHPFLPFGRQGVGVAVLDDACAFSEEPAKITWFLLFDGARLTREEALRVVTA